MNDINVQGPRRRSYSGMKTIRINVKGRSNGVHYIIPNVRHKNRLELKGTDGIISKGTKGRSLGRDNTYRKY